MSWRSCVLLSLVSALQYSISAWKHWFVGFCVLEYRTKLCWIAGAGWSSFDLSHLRPWLLFWYLTGASRLWPCSVPCLCARHRWWCVLVALSSREPERYSTGFCAVLHPSWKVGHNGVQGSAFLSHVHRLITHLILNITFSDQIYAVTLNKIHLVVAKPTCTSHSLHFVKGCVIPSLINYYNNNGSSFVHRKYKHSLPWPDSVYRF